MPVIASPLTVTMLAANTSLLLYTLLVLLSVAAVSLGARLAKL